MIGGVWGTRATALLVLTVMATAFSVCAALASGGSPAGSVVLGSGEIADDPWSASVGRERGAAQAGRIAELQPCIGISSKRIGGGKRGRDLHVSVAA
jgi:hypothetical protein